MAQNVTVAGASYQDVPSILLPKTGGGTASFTDVTDTTAAASDVASGKYFYTAAGVKTQGTASGGGGGGGAVIQDQDGYLVLDDEGGGSVTVEALNVTQNGTYTAPAGTAYSPVTVNVSGGGGDPWSWMGKNPTKVATLEDTRTYFKDTPIASWTWATSGTVIRASQTYTAATYDATDYDYIQLLKFNAHFDYGNWSAVNAVKDFAFAGAYSMHAYCRNTSAVQSSTPNGASSGLLASTYGLNYYSSNGSITYANQSNNGVYMTGMLAPTLSSTSTASPSVTWGCAAIQIKGNATYFTQDAFNNLDMDASYYDVVCEIWRVDGQTSDRSDIFAEIPNILNNGV